MIHPLSDVQCSSVGENTFVWQYVVILKEAVIGNNCNINCHTFVEGNVIIGDNVTIKSGVYLWDGITIEDNVFIGPNVTFTNDSHPRSKKYPQKFQSTIICKGASIGANATILGGIRIGRYAMIGAGSLVTKPVPDFALVYGSPASIKGWVDELGNQLIYKNGNWLNQNGQIFAVENNQLILIS